MIKTTAFGIAGLALSITAFAAPASATAIGACSSGISVDSFTSCEIGDKRFTLFDESLASTATLSFSIVGSTYILDINGINLTDGTAIFAYFVEVLDPDYVISSISVDSNVQPQPPQVPGGSTVTKEVYSTTFDGLLGTIVSTDGSVEVLSGLSQVGILVYESFNATDDQVIQSASNGITQTHVPAPAALGLLGLGLIGLGAAARRRKAA